MFGGGLLGLQPDLPCDRVARLFQDMPDQANRSCHHADAATDPPVEPHFAAQRAQNAGGIDGQRFALLPLGLGGHLLHQGDIRPGKPGFGGNRDQARGAGVDCGVAETLCRRRRCCCC